MVTRVAAALELDVGHCPDVLADRRPDAADGLDVTASSGDVADPRETNGHHRAAVEAWRQERPLPGGDRVADERRLARRIGQQVAPGADRLDRCRVEGVEVELRCERLAGR